jgi:phosphoribosylamine--glycine ligase
VIPLAIDEVQRLADFAAEMKIDLTVVGPELPLTLGIADELESRGLVLFGPSRRAAEIEGSKVFAKQFMERHGIPTAPFKVGHDAAEARAAAADFGFPVVLKADGLAAGKGVLVAQDGEELDAALAALFEERRFGSAADRVVVEAFLTGEEVSFMALSDGERILPLATAKDYKRIGEGDKGPNTGGMGAHSPSGVLAGESAAQIVDGVLRPTVAGMAEEGRPFVGVLYAGLMLTADGPKVIEYNVRFGDPEAQVVLPRLSSDLGLLLAQAAAGDAMDPPTFAEDAAVTVVLASEGYPEAPRTGDPITGIEEADAMDGVTVFAAGVAADEEGRLVTAGGRVLSVTGMGATLTSAREAAYSAVGKIHWAGMQHRTDIAATAAATERSAS